jgi:phage shock protein A
MLKRIITIIKSFFNKFLNKVEDPVAILENNIREMRNQIPKLNEGVARAHGTAIMLKRQADEYAKEEQALRAKLKVAASAGEDEMGQDIALQLQRTIEQKNKTVQALKEAQDGLKSMQDLRDTQIRKIKSETEKIKDTIEDSKVAKLKGELAQLFETYQVGDTAQVNKEMMDRLQEESAYNEGKLAAAADSVDMKQIQIEKDAERLQAKSLYEQFKNEMDMDISSKTQDRSKEKKAEKTIG